MDQTHWPDVRRLFDELVELPAEARAHRLAEVCGDDPELGARVTRLLQADARSAELLDALSPGHGADSVEADLRLADPIGMIGRSVAHFRVLDVLGAGGMGVVYRAEDTRLGRVVALKLPLPTPLLDSSGRSRFLREARVIAALEHPNVCEVHEVGETAERQLYLAMPLYAGESLRERLARDGALPERIATDIARQVSAGLAAAHAAGIVHRDLKPGNVMLLPDQSVKLLDFGLAKVSDASATATGERLGTIAYMAPEQVRGGPIDARTDLWALGAMLYEMLFGRRPFAGDSDISIAHAILHGAPLPLPRDRGVSPGLIDVVLHLLERDPGRRFASAEAVLAALSQESLARRPGLGRAVARRARGIGRRIRNARAVAIGLFVGLLVVVLLLTQQSADDPADSPELGGTFDSVARELYRRGRDYEARALSEDEFRSAGVLYRRAIGRDTGFTLARARHAITELKLLERSPHPDALPRLGNEIRAVIRRDRDLGDAHLAMALYWTALAEPESALASFRKARARLPGSGEVPLGVALIHMRAGRWQEAIAELEQARRLAPRDLETARALAFTYSRLRRYQDAAAAWELVTTLVPDDYLSLLIKGYVYIRWRGTADTLAAVLKRIPVHWDAGGMKTYATVVAARVRRQPALALQALDSARWLVSADVYTYRPIHLLRAQVFDDLGDSVSARRWYARTLALVRDTLAARPADPRLYITLGWANAGVGDPEAAIKAARRAMTLLPPQSNPYDGLPFMGAAAEVLARAGDVAGSVQLLDSLLRMPAGREASTMLLRADPTWDGIRNDPRFVALLRRHESM